MRSGSCVVVIFGHSRNQDAEICERSFILGSYLEVRINKKSICLASFVRSNTGRYFFGFLVVLGPIAHVFFDTIATRNEKMEI